MSSGNIEYEKRPEWFKNWEKTGLLKHEDKNGDGRIQYYNDADKSFASVVCLHVLLSFHEGPFRQRSLRILIVSLR